MSTTNDLRRVLHEAADLVPENSSLNSKVSIRINRCQMHRRLLTQILSCTCVVLSVCILAISCLR